MSDIFIRIFNLSITASWAVLAVILLRLVLKKVPKWVSCMLWGIVGLRLLLPFSVESIFSIIPSREFLPANITVSATPQVNSGIGVLNSALNPIISNTFAPDVIGAVTPMQILIGISAYIWLAGVFGMVIYAGISYYRLRLRVAPSISLRENIYYCDTIDSPFILGVFRPMIYLPSLITDSQASHIIDHEKAHLRRRDHIWKPLGFLILAVYWFNPVIWAAYILLCRDIERACDECVVKNMSDETRKSYSETLLSCSIRRRGVTSCPLAFGEVGVKDRIKSVLNYKKPAFWIIAVAVILCVAAAVCLLTVPKDTGKENYDNTDFVILEGGMSAIYVNDCGCDTLGVEIDFTRIITENGEVIFEIIWDNQRSTRHTIGPDFNLFRYDGNELIPLEQKGIFIDTLDFFVRANFQNIATYEITSHYDISEPGKYRFESHGAWIDFQIINYSLWYNKSTEYDSIKFDIDGDGEKELCGLYMGRTSGVFTFEVLIKDADTEEVEYRGTFYSEWITDLEFYTDGRNLQIKGNIQSSEKCTFDLSVSDGKLILTDHGIPFDQLK